MSANASPRCSPAQALSSKTAAVRLTSRAPPSTTRRARPPGGKMVAFPTCCETNCEVGTVNVLDQRYSDCWPFENAAVWELVVDPSRVDGFAGWKQSAGL